MIFAVAQPYPTQEHRDDHFGTKAADDVSVFVEL
jgi:hypothetical protein